MPNEDDLLEVFREITEVDSHQHVWKDGEYQGCMVTYANLSPPFRTMFHPYIPLTVCGEPWPKLTREYFLERGLSVPPGGERWLN